MLRALCEYYDLLRGRSGSDLPPDGYSVVGNVGWNLVLQEDGTIADILPYTQEVIVGKKIKTVGKSELFPFRNSVSGIAAETIDHREKYLFGMEWDKGSQTLVAGKRAVEAFEKCREVNLAFLEGISDPLAAAYCAFLRAGSPSGRRKTPSSLRWGRPIKGQSSSSRSAGRKRCRSTACPPSAKNGSVPFSLRRRKIRRRAMRRQRAGGAARSAA